MTELIKGSFGEKGKWQGKVVTFAACQKTCELVGCKQQMCLRPPWL